MVFRKTSSSQLKTYRIMKNPDEIKGTHISSADNPRFRELKKISSAEQIKKTGKILLSGKKLIKDYLKGENRGIDDLVLYDGYAESDEQLLSAFETITESGRLLIMKKSLYNELDVFNTNGPLISVPVPRMPEWDGSIGPGCTLAVPFQDPVNVGAVIRSAAGFGIKNILILRESANPYHPRSVRASAGSVFHAALVRGPSISEMKSIADAGSVPVIPLDARGMPLREYRFPESFILLPGLEGPGIPDDMKKDSIAIPLAGDVESLNGPVAVAVVLYELQNRK